MHSLFLFSKYSPLSDSNLSPKKKCLIVPLNKGFSLIELMVTIAIAAIMVTIAIPSLGEFVTKMRVDNEVSQINRLILTARNSAITNEQSVTLCPLGSNNACTSNWNNELSLFIDLDRDGVYEPQAPVVPPVPTETLIKVKAATSGGDNIIFAGQDRVTFAPTGNLTTAAGTFIYCPSDDRDFARAIIIAISGRSYLSVDENKDGKNQFRNGTNVNTGCPS